MQLPDVTGVILAGGQSTRMLGQDKGLVTVAGKSLYQHVLARLKPQVTYLVINANRHIDQYQQSGYPVINDLNTDYQGPLAGMLAGLRVSQTEWVLFSACDTPLIPLDLFSRLWQGLNRQKIAFAHDGERAHPTLSLMHISMQQPLAHYLAQGQRKLLYFFEQQQASTVYFLQQSTCFQNLNNPEDCQRWEQQYAK